MHHLKVPTKIRPLIQIVMKNRRAILTTTSVVSSAAAGAIVYRNSPEIHEIIFSTKQMLRETPIEDRDLRRHVIVDAIKRLTKLIGPIFIFYGISWGCAITSHRSSEKTIAALTTAYSLAETTIKEYEGFKKEVVKELGEEKVKNIEQEVIEETTMSDIERAFLENPIVVPPGEFLCYDTFSGHVFSSNADKLNLIQDAVNRNVEVYGSVYCNEILTAEKIEPIDAGNMLGYTDQYLRENGYSNWKDLGFELQTEGFKLSERFGFQPGYRVTMYPRPIAL